MELIQDSDDCVEVMKIEMKKIANLVVFDKNISKIGLTQISMWWSIFPKSWQLTLLGRNRSLTRLSIVSAICLTSISRL